MHRAIGCLGTVGVLLGVAAAPISTTGASVLRAGPAVPIGSLLSTLPDPAAAPTDSFGWSVAVAGSTAVVGNFAANSYSGVAYVYVKGASGWPTTPAVTLTDPAATANDYFGSAVAVSGSTILVGAQGTDTGAGVVYVYTRGTGGWPTTSTATLPDPVTGQDYDFFGSAVAVSGTTAVVGANGTPDDSDTGAAYVYAEGSSGWSASPVATLPDPGSTPDLFGTAVAVAGKTIVVGAPQGDSYDGAAYIYVRGSSGWSAVPTRRLSDPAAATNDYFGSTVALSGKTVVVGAPETDSGSGEAYVYTRGASGWPTAPNVTLPDPAATAGDTFGWSVALAGTVLVVGAPGTGTAAGATYFFVKGASGWSATPRATLPDPAATAYDDFGWSVALSGKTAVVGAVGTDTNDGATYLYKA